MAHFIIAPDEFLVRSVESFDTGTPRAGFRERVLAKQVGGAAWGLFFLWFGLATLADVGLGVGLVGVGVIALGAQVARRHFGL